MTEPREPRPLRTIRRAQLLTSQQLAERAGVSPVTVWRIEAGATKYTQVRVMRRIAEALGIRPEEIAEFTR
jgi:transcriptional regulator with XRE-family HTH domain